MLRSLTSAATDLIYPPSCLGCLCPLERATRDHPALCEACRSDCWRCGPACCRVCGEPFHSSVRERFICGTCRGRKFSFDFAVAAYQSRGVVRQLIHRFKYQRHLHLRALLAHLMEPAFADPRLDPQRDWLLVPVPLHRRRQRQREFNQAEELCRILSRRRGLPWNPCLRRVRDTKTQTRQRRDQRIANLEGAFRVRRPLFRREQIAGRSMLLIDDVFTTGSTADACASALIHDGKAENVVVITLARG